MQTLLQEHCDYLTDKIKLARYEEAIAKVVKPGDSVLDLGCGTGVLGLLALQHGADRVYAIDDSAALEIARTTFAREGFADKVHCLRGSSFDIELPERVDVIVCDHVGYFGIDYGILELLADARQRFLKPGGAVIPAAISLQLALVTNPAALPHRNAWSDGSVPAAYQWAASLVCNTKGSRLLDAADINGTPAVLQVLDLGTNHAKVLSWTTQLQVAHAGNLQAVAGWFDCELAAGVTMHNSPLLPEALNRPQLLLPFEQNPPLASGESVDVTLMMRSQQQLLVWRATTVSGVKLEQSVWNNMLFDVPATMQSTVAAAPRLNRRGRARQLLLAYCDGTRTAAEILGLMQANHAGLFASAVALELFVAEILAKESEA